MQHASMIAPHPSEAKPLGTEPPSRVQSRGWNSTSGLGFRVVKTGEPVVDEFNQMVMDVLNIMSGNFLTKGNTLTWNVLFTAPQVVDVEEWRTHAERWRKSIDADHGSPDGEGSKPRYFNGDRFYPGEELLKQEYETIVKFLKAHLHRF